MTLVLNDRNKLYSGGGKGVIAAVLCLPMENMDTGNALQKKNSSYTKNLNEKIIIKRVEIKR